MDYTLSLLEKEALLILVFKRASDAWAETFKNFDSNGYSTTIIHDSNVFSFGLYKEHKNSIVIEIPYQDLPGSHALCNLLTEATLKFLRK